MIRPRRMARRTRPKLKFIGLSMDLEDRHVIPR